MLIEKARCGARWQCFFRIRANLQILVVCLVLVSPWVAIAADYEIRTLSDGRLFSRDPVVSSTKLLVWTSYEQDGTRQTIVIHSNGTTRTLFALMPADMAASIRPQVQSNNIVFIAVVPPSGHEAWRLRQVPEPERDIPVRELPAIYRLESLKENRQEWVPASPEELEQHAAATAQRVVEVETNAAAEIPQAELPMTTNEVVSAESVANVVPPEQTIEPEIIPPPRDESQLKDLPRRLGSGDSEVFVWRGGKVIQITADNRDDLGPSVWGNLIAWQTAKGWPFGWEIMAWSDGEFIQLTTNFYYDMAPKVHEDKIVWYGWDGHDFEIFLYDREKGVTVQVTSNLYDDISPDLWGGVIVWEGYAGASADIFMWKDGRITKLSNNPEDDLNPRVWNGQVVWQGFDGEDFEIFYFNGEKTTKLTSNTFDDVNPDIRDGVICWMGYEGNWDSEIYVWDGGTDAKRLTEDEIDDRNPRTAAGWVVWESVSKTQSVIQAAIPRK